MTEQEQQAVSAFEDKLSKLIVLYETTRDRNKELQHDLDEAKNSLIDAHAEIDEWRTKYNDLKTARMVGFSEEDKKATYRQITNLVHEIDRCLDMLNN